MLTLHHGGSRFLKDELNKCVKGTLPQFLKVVENKDKNFADYFKKFLCGQKLYACNLFIGSKKIFNEWMEFFFNVIIDFEKICPIGPGTNTLRREGYFSEFMFGAWLEYKGYKIVNCNICKFSKDFRIIEQYMSGPTKRINEK